MFRVGLRILRRYWGIARTIDSKNNFEFQQHKEGVASLVRVSVSGVYQGWANAGRFCLPGDVE